MRQLWITLLIWLASLGTVWSEGADDPSFLPGARPLIERDVDYFGGDLRALFDTTFAACQVACESDPACVAFTFNTRSQSCFPKRGVDDRTAYVGALSAIVRRVTDAEHALARRRATALSFLSRDDFSAAQTLAAGLTFDRLAGDTDAVTLAEAAEAARRAGRFDEALGLTRRALVLSDDASLWAAYGRDARVLAPDAGEQRRRFHQDARSAAINAYLRARSPDHEAEALRLLAKALEDQGRGRDGLSALRLADRTVPSPVIAQDMQTFAAKYGFRILESRADSEGPSPRICAVFSEPLARGVDFAPYIRLPGIRFAVEARDTQLCIEGLEHGKRYAPTFRAGLPAASGEGLIAETAIALYVRDRTARVSFPGRAYVLPRGPAPALPIRSTNAEEVALTLHRVAERNLRLLIEEGTFGRPLNTWEADRFTDTLSEVVWSGTGTLANTLNTEVTTLLPLDDIVTALPAGIYAMRAELTGGQDAPPATQWFLISDLGIATMEGTGGLTVTARSLGSARPMADVTVRLVSRANRVLAEARTDAQGQVRFAREVSGGRGGAAPALVLAHTQQDGAPDDFAFLSLTDPAFDLSDRGVAGRAPAGPVDVFLSTDRGAYRAGETIHATVLARDDRAGALPDVPLTAVLTRPDGVEYARTISTEGLAGGHVFALPVAASAPRGTWALAIHLDPEGPALARQALLVEDFLPERIDVTLAPPLALGRGSASLGVSARYLFGATGSDLAVEGETVIRAAETVAGWPGFRFGRHDDSFEPHYASLAATRTDAEGRAKLALATDLPDAMERPLELLATVRVSEGSGRPVERRATIPVALDEGLVVGIKPAVDGVVAEGAEAQFEIVTLDGRGAAQPARVTWSLNRITRHYQWYNRYGRWAWEPITRRSRIAGGSAETGPVPIEIAAPVDWGQYELEVERSDGAYAASSVTFYAGWYARDDQSDSPDRLEVALDRDTYRPGDTAMLRIVPPETEGIVHIAVIGSRVIHETEIAVTGATTVPLSVTEDWGAGAYVAATLYRPGRDGGGRVPTRALGIAYAPVDPGPARLATAFEVPTEARPRAPLDIALRVDAPEGDTVWATIAAVDQGILNLTGHLPPDPEGHYFGQRRLGVGLRDLYGRLIDASQGTLGQIRSGGDAAAQLRMEAAPPTEDLVAFFSGPLQVGPDGFARTQIDLPSFNGAVRLMAVAWSATGIGQAETTVTVRDPVVLTASVPRFLSPGDRAQMRLDLVHAEGPTGPAAVQIAAQGVTVEPAILATEITPDGRVTLPVTVTAEAPGLATLDLTLTTPGGEKLRKRLRLPVRVGDPEVLRQSRFTLAPGATFTLSDDLFAGFHPGTGTATVATGALARFDVPGLLRALDRTPYGCTEQIVSQSLPLLYMDPLAQALGLHTAGSAGQRVAEAIDTVLSRQTSGGGFGLWTTYDSDPWLDAFVADFLGRAKRQGHAVPDLAFSRALDALQNGVNAAPDFDAKSEIGRGLAYGLYVLAREGAATLGDLRYYADVKATAFDTALAKAQLGAALATYGEQARAERLFALAREQLSRDGAADTGHLWRSDYGSRLRDTAAVLTLAAETGIGAVDLRTLAERVAQPARLRSTQEQLWTLLAAQALAETGSGQIAVDGAAHEAPVLRVDQGLAQPMALRNDGAETELTVTAFGIPATPPAAQGNGYAITRSYYTLSGSPADLSDLAQGDRLVTVLSIRPFGPRKARLMVNDPLPAGFEIDNPNLIRGGDIAGLDWLRPTPTRHTEFRQDRFLAAVDWSRAEPFSLAYIVRAVSPGDFYHAAAGVEDMYRPDFRANTAAGRIVVSQ